MLMEVGKSLQTILLQLILITDEQLFISSAEQFN